MTRGRIPVCKCCGSLSASSLCGPCGSHHTQRLAAAQAAVLALWGTAGLAQWQTEIRVRRLAGRRRTAERPTS